MLAYAEFSVEIICVLMFISMMIQPFIGLLAWLENKVTNSNEVNHYSKGEELVQASDEINLFFEHDKENTIPGVVWANCACSFCGKLSHITTRCSRCKDALYCSKLCHVMHARFWHKYECVEIETTEAEEGSPSHGTRCLFMEPENETSVYLFNEFSDETATHRHGIASGYDGCAVCGNPSSKKCSRCKAIKYCSQTCQHFDWRSGHKFQCIVEKENSTQGRPAHGNVVMPTNSYGVEEENINAKALILSSQVATNKGQKEVEEQLRSLKEELAKIKNENISLQSEREEWEMRAKFEVDRLYSFRKENEHQLFILKHENKLLSNAEKQARQMINSLSERQHCLQVMVEKQEAYTHMLENECSKVKTQLQEQNKCVERLTLELAEATQFPMRVAEETRQKLANGFSAVATAEVSQPISLSRNPTFTRQACAICMTNEKDMAFGCGHMTCKECGSKIRKCHTCRKKITSRIRLFPG